MSNISTFFGLQTSLRGLLAHQRSLDVTGHNITNANTEGYSRQEAVLQAATPLEVEAGLLIDGGGAQLGAGVGVQAFRRIRDSFLDLQYRGQNLRQGYNETTAQELGNVEDALAEPGDSGISALLGKFWSAWSDVANQPENLATRQTLIDQAKTLAAAAQDLSARITASKAEATAEYASITGAAGDVAGMATEIAQLNQSIKFAVSNGDQPNDLFDRRDLLIDKLSQLGQVSVTDLGNGSIQLAFGDAALPLVNDQTVNWPQALGTSAAGPGGKLGALLDLSKAGGTYDSYLTDVNAFAKTLADTVNALHNPGGTGTNFFTYTAGNEAATLTVNVTTATVRYATGAAPGANDIAIAISGLRGGAADQAYTSFVARIGADVKQADRLATNAKVLATAVEDRRQSTSGVSLDEEMANMVRFQRGYQASARAMSTVDEMLDTLINRTGRVGL